MDQRHRLRDSPFNETGRRSLLNWKRIAERFCREERHADGRMKAASATIGGFSKMEQ
jgi:hypothetical protein